MKRELKMQILQALTYATIEADHGDKGICTIMHSHLSWHDWCAFDNWMERQLRKWPHWSGHPLYPVVAPAESESGSSQYDEAQRTRKLWDNTTEYGRLRWDLLRHLIM